MTNMAPWHAVTFCQDACQPIDPLGNGGQALGPVVHGKHGGDVGQQSLRGADVGCGLVTPDVLLASLHCHSQCLLAVHISADACTALKVVSKHQHAHHKGSHRQTDATNILTVQTGKNLQPAELTR